MIKGIIYDMDDVIVNSYPLYYEALKIILDERGVSFEKIPAKVRPRLLGRRLIDTAELIIKYTGIDMTSEDYLNKLMANYEEIIKTKLTLLPGLIQSLELFKINKFKLALGTSGIRSYVNFVLKRFKLKKYFDIIVGSDQVKKGKPDPEVYLTASKELGLAPRECLVLEDATSGIKSAKAAGCKCIAIKNSYTPPQDLKEADLVLSSLEEINLQIIKSLSN